MKKGDIIYTFLSKLDKEKELVFSELGNIEFDADNDGEILDYLSENDLIKSKTGKFSYDAFVYIRPTGKKILKHDNWTDFINSQLEKEKSEQQKEQKKRELQNKIDNLNLDELEYKEKIRGLEEQLKIISLIKAYWWVMVSFFGLGMLLAEQFLE